MSSGALKQFVERLDQLPTLSPVATELVRVTEDPEAHLSQVAGIIESDPALTARLLKIANSAYFGVPRRVATVQQATALLGLNLVRSVALSVAVIQVLDDHIDDRFDLRAFWTHSAAVGIFSSLLARRFRLIKPEEAFVAGLLHDLGRLVLYVWEGEKYFEILKEAETGELPLIELEELYLNASHTWAAKLAMEYWKFPPSLVSPAWLHHQPLTHFGPNPTRQLEFVVKCANSLCHIQQLGFSGDPGDDLSIIQLQETTGLSQDEFSALSAQAVARLESMSSVFDWDASPHEKYLEVIASSNIKLSKIHLELASVNRGLREKQKVMESILRLQQAACVPLSPAGLLKIVVGELAGLVSHKRLLGFMVPKDGCCELQGFIVEGRDQEARDVALRLDLPRKQPARSLKVRELVLLIQNASQELEREAPLRKLIAEALAAADLIVLPVCSGEETLALLFVEALSGHSGSNKLTEMLQPFAHASAHMLNHLMTLEKLDSQTEKLARLARKAELANTQLFQAERLASVGRLAAGAAHEINNPLTIISAQTELLLNQQRSEEQGKGLQVILDQAGRISKIVSDLMGLSKPAQPRIEPTSLEGILERTLSVLETRLKLSCISLQREYSRSLSPIMADPKQMEQVFLNLLLNSIQSMDQGGTLTVRLLHQDGSDNVEAQISDTGAGIEPADLPNIFDPFFTTKPEGKGSGLGLAICHSIVEGHGGRIEVSSDPGRGSTFTLRLPVLNGKIKSESRPEMHRPGNPPAKIASNEQARVLLIDDEPALCRLLKESFSECGLLLDSACDGRSGLEQLEHNHYDLILLDLRLPGQAGLEFMETVRGMAPETPIFVVTGIADEEELHRASELGALRCIRKPFVVDDLIRLVQDTLVLSAQSK